MNSVRQRLHPTLHGTVTAALLVATVQAGNAQVAGPLSPRAGSQPTTEATIPPIPANILSLPDNLDLHVQTGTVTEFERVGTVGELRRSLLNDYRMRCSSVAMTGSELFVLHCIGRKNARGIEGTFTLFGSITRSGREPFDIQYVTIITGLTHFEIETTENLIDRLRSMFRSLGSRQK